MPRFFIAPTDATTLEITGGDAQHISKSLRMEVGDALVLCDGVGWDYHGEILHFGQGVVAISVLEKIENKTEPAAEIVLYQALPKGDKFGFITEKAVELGASKIVPVLTSRCISRPNEKSMERKIERYTRTAEEAAKQSDRGIIPQIGDLLEYEEALEQATLADIAILFYEKADKPLREILTTEVVKNAKTIAVIIGSEGGFSPEEIQLARGKNLAIASLGSRILRCETAPITALSAILYALGEF